MTAADSIFRDSAQWDAAVLANGGHLLQGWNWGAFKSEFGWNIERVAVSSGDRSATAQILFRSRGPVSVGYIPRGPAVPDDDPEIAQAMINRIDAVSRKRRALYTIFEIDRALPFDGTFRAHLFVRGPERIQPARTVKVALLPDDQLLAQMRQNTRYSVRLAIRRNVTVCRGGESYGVDDFYRLLADTSDRNKFGIHARGYYARFLDLFGDKAISIYAQSDGHLAAALIGARFGDEAIYMYGASSTEYRQHGAAFLLQYEAMRWARDNGCKRYDLWGIPRDDPGSVSDSGDSIAGTKGNDWRGLFRFKTGFGGEIVDYPPSLERRYHRLGAFVARRMISEQRGDS